MKQTILFNLAMAVCLVLSCYSIYMWNDYLIAVMSVLSFCVFMITKWYVQATEMPEDFTNQSPEDKQ
jgi:hypothetical protein